MKRLRVVCAADRADEVRSTLAGQPGVAHVVGEHTEAGGPEVIEALVDRSAVDAAVDALRALDIDRDGAISVSGLDLVYSRDAERAHREAGDDDDVVVWNELVATTGDDSAVTPEFLAFLSLACMLAAAGVITDSAVTIVGAMVVSPDFGPLAAVIVGAVARRRSLLRHALVAIVVGFTSAMVITGLFGLALRFTGLLEKADLENLGVVSFVYQAGPYSVIVAVLAGAAGMLALTSSKSGVLIGVSISLTTIPAAGYAALAAQFGLWSRFGEALAQLGLNMLGVLVGGTLVLWIRRSKVTGAPVSRTRLTAGRARPRRGTTPGSRG